MTTENSDFPGFDNHVFGQPTSITHTVGERKTKFWPVSAGMMLELRTTLEPLSNLIRVLTNNVGKAADQGQKTVEANSPYVDDNGEVMGTVINGKFVPIRDVESVIQAASLEVIQYRDSEMVRAIQGILEVLTDDKNIATLCSMIQDSLRVPKEKRVIGKDLVTVVDGPIFIELATGMVIANKGVFGPLGEMVAPLLSQAKEFVAKHTEPETKEDKTDEAEATESEEQNEQNEPVMSIPQDESL